MTDRPTFAKWVRWLRAEFPLCHPVRVYLVDPKRLPPDHMGMCYAHFDEANNPCAFAIHVSRSLDWQAAQSTLFEEWAHALRMHCKAGDVEKHDDVFGAWFNTIRRTWHGEHPA